MIGDRKSLSRPFFSNCAEESVDMRLFHIFIFWPMAVGAQYLVVGSELALQSR